MGGSACPMAFVGVVPSAAGCVLPVLLRGGHLSSRGVGSRSTGSPRGQPCCFWANVGCEPSAWLWRGWLNVQSGHGQHARPRITALVRPMPTSPTCLPLPEPVPGSRSQSMEVVLGGRMGSEELERVACVVWESRAPHLCGMSGPWLGGHLTSHASHAPLGRGALKRCQLEPLGGQGPVAVYTVSRCSLPGRRA